MVSKRLGNAVARNRIKRRLREAVKTRDLYPGWDAVFIARRGSQNVPFRDLDRAVSNLLRRSRILNDQGQRDSTGVSKSEVSS